MEPENITISAIFVQKAHIRGFFNFERGETPHFIGSVAAPATQLGQSSGGKAPRFAKNSLVNVSNLVDQIRRCECFANVFVSVL